MHNLLQTFLCLLISVSNIWALERLVVQGGEVYEGELLFVKKRVVYLQSNNKQVAQIPMALLDASAKQRVQRWIRQQGGSDQYASWIKNGRSEFTKPWPRTVYGPKTVGLKLVQRLSKTKPLIYESTHFRFIVDTKVEQKIVQRFAVLFETTHKYVLAMPINASARYRTSKQKLEIYLFGTRQAYHRAGGPAGSGGVYFPRNESVLVPMTSLGVRWDGRKWQIQKKEANTTLVHEIVHQLTSGVNFAPWYIEGSAEYVAALRYTHGVFHSGPSTRQRAFEYVRAKNGMKDGSGRGLGARVKMMPLQRFMNLNYQQFTGIDANKHYGVGMLLTHYFYHKHGRGNGAAMKKYIGALQLGKSEREAQKLLLAGMSYAQLQEKFRKYCAQYGVKIEFQK